MSNASQEMVDIVDENNVVLRQIPKKEAHEKGLLHRTVISEIKNSKGDWTLTKQASDRQDAGQYVSPIGGHALAGESEDKALKRETLEEFGFEPTNFKLAGKAIFNRYVLNRQENHYFVLYEIYTDTKSIPIKKSLS